MLYFSHEKIDARKLSTEGHPQIRSQAIHLKKSGRTHRETSDITGVHVSTIARSTKLISENTPMQYESRKEVDALAVAVV